ncbi:hypothetical protein [Embleya hyalina]|uniref:Uncharacterized protein n=1 Tax=Embleya hyalina TaxID=516124 RepID=A0A401YSR8_9ACTN|nr:hypothetical protein [Embleya hyalina]GCD97651.1 hypothetical protein EHYA_05347 [Embleya hyalina]
MISNVVVTSEFPRTGGGAGAGRATGRRTAIGCSGGGVTTGGVGGGVVGGGGGVFRTGGGVALGTTTAIGVSRTIGGGGVLRTGVGFVGGGVGGGVEGGVGLGVVGLGVVGVGDGLGLDVGRQDPLRTKRKSTVSPIPPVGGPVAGVTSTRTLAPGDPPIETHTSTCAPGVCPPPEPDPAHATLVGAANKAPAPTAHPHRRARPHALMAAIVSSNHRLWPEWPFDSLERVTGRPNTHSHPNITQQPVGGR